MLDNNNKLWFSILLCQAIIKVWSTFSKVVGIGKAHKYFLLTLLCSSRQTARQFASDKVYNIGRYYELCLTRVLNHNLLQLLIKQQYKLPKNSKIKYSKTSTHKRQTKKALPK